MATLGRFQAAASNRSTISTVTRGGTGEAVWAMPAMMGPANMRSPDIEVAEAEGGASSSFQAKTSFASTDV